MPDISLFFIFFVGNGVFRLDIQSIVNYGGTGLSLLCFLFSIAFFCCFRNVCKRLKRLEQLYEKNKRKSLIPNTLKHQISNVSNAPTDIDTIPIVTRRSEYIRSQRNQRMASVAKELRTRVSRFIFGSRSSADTFDLSDREEPIYDDITQYRAKLNMDEKQGYICCCCCRNSSYYAAADTDSQSKEKNGGQSNEPGPSEIITTITKEEIEQITNCNEVGNYATHKKDKKEKTIKTASDLRVQHVDFDVNETIIQPTTADDITIDVITKPVKQVNTENQLSSFGTGRKRMIGQAFDKSPIREHKKLASPILPQKTVQQSNTFISKKKRMPGSIKLPLPVPLKPAKSMPSVLAVTATDDTNTEPDQDEKERDPSYIDMSETLKKS